MSIVPYLPQNCELAAGPWLLRLLFISLLLLSWATYQQAYPRGWAHWGAALQVRRPWRLKPRTPEACEACQKEAGLGHQRLRSPGMAAGLTRRLWTVGKLLQMPLWPALA